MKRTVIVAGGKKEPDILKSQIVERNSMLLIAADSGMEVFYQLGIAPDVIVGDFDSVRPDVVDYFRKNPQIIFKELNPIKDDTDTESAIRLAISMGAAEIVLLGATGSRLDHVLGNIELLAIGLKAGVPITMLDANNRICMIEKDTRLSKKEQYGSYVSFIPYEKNGVEITLRGFKYPLEQYLLTGGTSLCISNEIVADEAEVILKKGVLLMIESKD